MEGKRRFRLFTVGLTLLLMGVLISSFFSSLNATYAASSLCIRVILTEHVTL